MILSFKGNKASLPSKICLTCGREMVWRKSWAKNWGDVKFCSNRCRGDKAQARSLANSSHQTK
ncbi:MAG TPA: DUF2256 domain-containing protein [Casimicrobium sp.]|nr:DUF2256 domain-containing protein [Casimicrobium sp.]